MTQKNDTPLFVFGSHTKKRPRNLVFGRTYDGQILEMIELGFENYQSLLDLKGNKKGFNTKPVFVFQGEEWVTDDLHQRIQNIFLDTFRGMVVDKVNIAGLDHVIIVTAADGKILFRPCALIFKKSGCKLPRVELEEMGPNFDFTVRRSRLPSTELYKQACKTRKAVHKAPKVKNVSRSEMGDKVGRIHLGRQDFAALDRTVKRPKVMRESKKQE
eukprot:GCRY01001527.1.p1 GENE.GCRY01001527.1~~GCRY01001527.1.p1  ORF type:complete len:215 (+),score=41.12 GCRY01001527.1:324-968(+)